MLTVRRDTIALAVGTTICLIAGFYPWFEVPSAERSWLDADQLLHIVAMENPFSIATRMLLLTFSLISALMLVLRFQRVRTIRHAAIFLLFAYLLAPQWILNWSADELKDSQIVYNHVDRVITDMELGLIHQQADWRAAQSFRTSARDRPSLIEEPAFESWTLGLLEWSGQEEVFDQIFGLSNSFLNIANRGWYGAVAGLLVWLLGAYGGSVLSNRIRVQDLRLVPILAIGMLVCSLFPRAVAEVSDRYLMRDLAAGDYRSATTNLADASFWSPIRDLSIGYRAQAGTMAEQLDCVNCSQVLIANANIALYARNYLKASELLDQVADLAPDSSGLRYWRALAHAGLGFDLFNAGQYSGADRQFAVALNLVPIDALVWYGRAMAHLRMRDERRAADFLEQAVRIQEHLNFRRLTLRAQWYVLRSWSDYRDGQFDAAHANYVKQLTPESW
jgi:tetratricopeptide (TPR) repeat protein